MCLYVISIAYADKILSCTLIQAGYKTCEIVYFERTRRMFVILKSFLVSAESNIVHILGGFLRGKCDTSVVDR